MRLFGCCFWWFVLGLLLGWLLNWLLSRWLRRDPPQPSSYRRTDLHDRADVHGQADHSLHAAPPPPSSYRRTDLMDETDPPRAAAAVPPVQYTLVDLAAARAAGFQLKHADDLTIVEGIGPKIDALLRSAGVTTFRELAAASFTQLRTILDNGGARFQIANPGSWPQQAALAAENRWAELKALQDTLDAGVASPDHE